LGWGSGLEGRGRGEESERRGDVGVGGAMREGKGVSGRSRVGEGRG